MLKWLDILKFANFGTPEPDQKIEKSEEEWKNLLTPEQFLITRKKGTERPNSSELCNLFEAGKYSCICCDTPLFDSEEKFESGTGWPSFTQPIKENAVAYFKDKSFGMTRMEAICNTCDAHLGHVFPDGPPPSNLRFCINAISLKKIESTESKIVLGGGCFWCTEVIFQELKGVLKVNSGYSGGRIHNPTYREVSNGTTGHAEVVEITYDNSIISFEDLVKIHLTTHNPTTINKQGADRGTQYRSIIFYKNESEKTIIENAIKEIQETLDEPIVTEVKKFETFYIAEEGHQDYYLSDPKKQYCENVINPKLKKFRELYKSKLK